ncbi:unnamed protein product [Protopolystoma xenopodis]|uniref:Uncharacterized protein n=1 Tax=Protopolystoma xenopodis TaxID=117903 RepID=A0A3S5C456_9PLAT|nr:unnamed protein product [Protopolystoma xenopodis]
MWDVLICWPIVLPQHDPMLADLFAFVSTHATHVCLEGGRTRHVHVFLEDNLQPCLACSPPPGFTLYPHVCPDGLVCGYAVAVPQTVCSVSCHDRTCERKTLARGDPNNRSEAHMHRD